MEKKKNTGGKLKKELGLFSGVSLVAGMTIGSGIYYLGSYVLQRTNMSMGMALVCWLVGGLYMFSAVLLFIGLAVIYNLDKKTLATMNAELAARHAAE